VRIPQTSIIGVQCSFSISKHIRPSLYTFGWNIGVENLTSGGFAGYSEVKASTNRNEPPSHGVYSGLLIFKIK
jgi:hypothetical protein